MRTIYKRQAMMFFLASIAFVFLRALPCVAGENVSPLPVIAGENLIRNPGFENLAEDYQWKASNWWKGPNGEKNIVTYLLDSQNPHRGDVSQRIAIQTLWGGNVQLKYSLPSLKSKTAVQVRFWARGEGDKSSLKVLFRRMGPPYSLHHSSTFSLTNQWHEYTFYATMSEKATPGQIGILFQLEKKETIWLDDVRVVELPTQDQGEPLIGNQIQNGSFEVGRDRWYATFRESGRYANAPAAQQANINADLSSRVTPDAPQGQRTLRFSVGKNCKMRLTSAYFPLRYGYPTTITFWLKAPKAGQKIYFSACQGNINNLIRYRKVFRSPDAKWNQYTFLFTPEPSSSRTYFIEFKVTDEGTYWLDAIASHEGKMPPATYTQTVNVGWEPVGDSHPANLFNREDLIQFSLLATAAPGIASLDVRGQIIDAWGHQVQPVKVHVRLNEQGNGSTVVTFPSTRYGSFKCQLYLLKKESEIPVVEIVYHVLPQLKPLKNVRQSYFGGHFQLTPYNLRIAEKGGFRWIRLHPPLNTKWAVVEPEKNKFVFSLAGVKRAAAKGFKVLGSFDTTPKFYTDAYFKNKAWLGFGNGFPPNNWQAWEQYVAKTAKAFYPYIQHWEIWNEPNVRHFLRVKPGEQSAKVYFDICQHTQKAVIKTGLNLSLIGGAMAQALILPRHHPFNTRILSLGINKEIDAFSFHHYGPSPNLSEQQQLAGWQKFINRKGRPLAIWNTEGGPAPGTISSWLRTARIPTLDDVPVAQVASQIIRTLVAFKAIGVKQNFLYHGFAQPAGRIVYRNACANLIDVNGIALPSLVAHATAVRFLEGTQPLGLREVKVGANPVVIASFRKGKTFIDVVWPSQTEGTGGLKKETLLRGHMFDMMGNPYSGVPGTTRSPVYILGQKKG